MQMFKMVMFGMISLFLVSVSCLFKSYVSYSLVIADYGSFGISFIFDGYSLSFGSTLAAVVLSVLIFSRVYMAGDKSKNRFDYKVLCFVFSMLFLVFSGNFFTSLIAWDLLGVTSFLLIIYYLSTSSMKSGLIAYLLNRIGDCFFVIMVSMIICYPDHPYWAEYKNIIKLVGFLALAISITKSAQIPYSSWLPAAMEAPTPVSALVHSSTLVTAGIYLLVRYSSYWENNDVIREILITLSFSTLVMASFVAMGENDVKKVVALSTLSQLGLIMFALGNGMLEVGFFHLITHAYYKALMFIVVGYLLHNAGGNQDLKGVFLSSNTPMLYIILCCSSMALTGMPFLSGFYSKDLLVDMMMKISYYKVLGLIFTFILTLIYTTRVVFNLMNNYRKFFSSSMKKSSRWSMILLFIFSCVYGVMFSWLINIPEYTHNNSKVFMFMVYVLVVYSTWLKLYEKAGWQMSTMWFMNWINTLYLKCVFYIGKKFFGKYSSMSFFDFANKRFIEKSFRDMSKNMSKFHKNKKIILVGIQYLLIFITILSWFFF